MHDYFFRPEVVRLALILGVVVSMLFYERMQLTSGGAIVPAYIALFLQAPLYVATAVVAGYLTYLCVSVLLAKRMIVYGRRKFELEILVGLGFISIGALLAQPFGDRDPRLLGLAGIGFVVPGVMAHDMFRQRPLKTLGALFATAAIVALIIYIFVATMAIAPIATQPPVELSLMRTAYPIELLLPAVFAGVVFGVVLFAFLGIRSGGFVTGAYLALVLDRPSDIAFALACAAATYLVVVRLLMPRLMLFGRRKLASMLLVASLITWSAEIAVAAAFGFLPWRGFTVATLVVPALLANDAQRQGPARTAFGALIVATAVFGTMNLLAGVTGLA